MTSRERPEDRPTFRIELRPEPHVTDAIKALRRALKFCLRICGLRAISAVEVQSDAAKTAHHDPIQEEEYL
jgi:hypothetical protein